MWIITVPDKKLDILLDTFIAKNKNLKDLSKYLVKD